MGTGYAFYSLAGGSGKTLLAVNTAAAIGREMGKDVLLVDCTIPARSDIGSYLNVPKKRSVSQLIPVIDTADPKLIQEYPVACRGGLRYLALVMDGAIEESENEHFQEKSIIVLTRLISLFDYVVFDISLSYSSYVETLLELSDRIIIPFEASTVSLISASHTMDFLKQRNFPRRSLMPVLNKAPKKTIIDDELITKRLGRSVLHRVPFDNEL